MQGLKNSDRLFRGGDYHMLGDNFAQIRQVVKQGDRIQIIQAWRSQPKFYIWNKLLFLCMRLQKGGHNTRLRNAP